MKNKITVTVGALAQGNAQDGYIYVAQGVQAALARLNAWADTIHDISPEDVTWGHVGHLNHIEAKLQEIVSELYPERNEP